MATLDDLSEATARYYEREMKDTFERIHWEGDPRTCEGCMEALCRSVGSPVPFLHILTDEELEKRDREGMR